MRLRSGHLYFYIDSLKLMASHGLQKTDTQASRYREPLATCCASMGACSGVTLRSSFVRSKHRRTKTSKQSACQTNSPREFHEQTEFHDSL